MMTQNDIENVLDLLMTAYGEKSYPVDDQKKMAKIANLWSVMFVDDEPAEVLTAVKDCIATLQFPPKVADIKSRIAQNRLSGQMTEMEAWLLIRKAVEDANSREKAQQIYNALPPMIKKLCNPSQLRAWRTVEDEQFETVVCSNVLRSYRVLLNREAGYHALPADIQKAEQWRIEAPKSAEKAPELPKPAPTMENITQAIGFEPPYYMMPTVEQWIKDGLSAAEIRRNIMAWGA